MSKHLDLGCGNCPKNPYGSDDLYGIDIRAGLGENILSANLTVQRIPFPASTFSSVSAYDFLEHVPRVVVDMASKTSFFPFITLMNEIWRVLEPSGRFYAVTPVYPHHKAFVDPTHVNFISRKTHEYFVGANPMARMYGFEGRFELLRAQKVRPRHPYEPTSQTLSQRLHRYADALSGKHSHMIWEFLKP